MILHSEVKATLHVKDIWLDLQSGFEHTGKGDGRPTSNLFPLVIAPSSRAGILLVIRLSALGGETFKISHLSSSVATCNSSVALPITKISEHPKNLLGTDIVVLAYF